jgi:heterodisulfide reductase subunit A
MNTDLVVLCVGQEPSEATEKLSKMLYKDLDVDGFFKEINLEYATIEEKGVFIAGCAQGPRGIRYSVADGKIAAANAIAILEKANVELYPIRAHVVEERCDGCGFCIDPCPYKAITVVEYVDKGAEKKIVRLNEATCRGCGICVATCPKRGILVRHFTSEQLSAMIDAALAAPRDGEEPLILAFACDWCGYPASDMAGVARIVYPDNVRIIRVMCSGMVHPDLIMTALTKGADGVLVLGCHPGECYYIDGNLKAEKRGEAIRLMLEDFGLNPRRYRSEWLAGSEPEKFIQAVNSMMEELREERK